jgi:hypothetical protein
MIISSVAKVMRSITPLSMELMSGLTVEESRRHCPTRRISGGSYVNWMLYT